METLFSTLNLHPSGFDIAGVRFCCDLHICWNFRFSFPTYAFFFQYGVFAMLGQDRMVMIIEQVQKKGGDRMVMIIEQV